MTSNRNPSRLGDAKTIGAGAAFTALLAIFLLTATGAAHPQNVVTFDYDADNDNLIEIRNLEQLNALRWDPDGDGVAAEAGYAAAFPNAVSGMGCPATCQGYELQNSLDFDSDASYANASVNKALWTTDKGWTPIPSLAATLDGNDNTIANLYVNRPDAENVGLFGVIAATGRVEGLGVTGLSSNTARENAGGLAGLNNGDIVNSYTTGSIEALSNPGGEEGSAGGLVATNSGRIIASYSTCSLVDTYGKITLGAEGVGGLVGVNSGKILASYATGSISGTVKARSSVAAGGLVGYNAGTVAASYATGAAANPVATGLPVSGGLVGFNAMNIRDGYSTGRATIANSPSTGFTGGLIGYNVGTVSAMYWDTETSGNAASAAGVGKTTAELKGPTGYTGIYADWRSDLDGDPLTCGDEDPLELWHRPAIPHHQVFRLSRSLRCGCGDGHLSHRGLDYRELERAAQRGPVSRPSKAQELYQPDRGAGTGGNRRRVGRGAVRPEPHVPRRLDREHGVPGAGAGRDSQKGRAEAGGLVGGDDSAHRAHPLDYAGVRSIRDARRRLAHPLLAGRDLFGGRRLRNSVEIR